MSISVYDVSPTSVPSVVKTSPVVVRAFRFETLVLPAAGTHFGFVWQGDALLRRDGQRSPFPVASGMYFSVAEAATLDAQNAVGIVITAPDYQGQFLLGGPVESSGRFPYIDGGTTSLLVAPMAVGDPCLHALYMPPNVDQTVHHHPSDRIGIIINGGGQCCGEDTCYELRPGSLFYISADQRHRFVTGEQGLDLVVFHPDSDMGFSDRSHPMLSRTLVNDVRATDLPELQTLL
ncbi:MAG: cupin domain-containing protein [Cyanobacteria bacterium J06621_3]